MLFALDWMKRTWSSIISAILSFTDGLNLFSVSAALRAFWLIAAAVIIAGAVLCFLGFRFHKLVHGFIGAALLGALGWYIGTLVNRTQITVWAVWAVTFTIVGFFVIYLCYFLNVLAGGYLLFLAILAPLKNLLNGYIIFIALVLAVIYCAFYIKYKLAMTAVTGAILLGLVFYGISPIISLIITVVFAAAGIYAQITFRRKYEAQMRKSMQEQIKKYPYGPGLVYGWEDPTLSRSHKK